LLALSGRPRGELATPVPLENQAWTAHLVDQASPVKRVLKVSKADPATRAPWALKATLVLKVPEVLKVLQAGLSEASRVFAALLVYLESPERAFPARRVSQVLRERTVLTV